MNSPFLHFLITRFNVRLNFLGANGRDPDVFRNDKAWLHDRIDLFETFCVPSVCAQLCPSFVWLILIDGTTPNSVVKRLSDCLRCLPCRWELIKTKEHFLESVRDYLDAQCAAVQYILTSRVDSDDAIDQKFISTIQEQFDGQEFAFFSFPNGYTFERATGHLRRLWFPENQFPTLIERAADRRVRTVYCRNHVLLKEQRLVHFLESEGGAWLQVVHRWNLYNTHRGKKEDDVPRAKATSILEKFGIQLKA